VEKRRRDRGESIPTSFEQAVQSVFNRHCLDSEVFKKRGSPEEGFFHSDRASNSATWSVDELAADAWLLTRRPHYELAQAISRLKGVAIERTLSAVEKASDEERTQWRSNARVKAKLAEIRAEKAYAALEREELLNGPEFN